MAFFIINFSIRENPGAPYRNLNTDAQLQAFLYEMASIIVVKITLHHSVYSRRATHDPHHGTVIEDVRAIFVPH